MFLCGLKFADRKILQKKFILSFFRAKIIYDHKLRAMNEFTIKMNGQCRDVVNELNVDLIELCGGNSVCTCNLNLILF